MTEIIIVNGDDAAVTIATGTTGRQALAEALWATGNAGRPVEDWCLWDVAGQDLDLGKPLIAQTYKRPLLATLKMVGGLEKL